MPAIPFYQQQTSASGTITAQADPSAFGAETARAGQRLGGALQDVSNAGLWQRHTDAIALREQQEKDAKSWSGAAISQATLDWTEDLQKRKQSALPGAPDFTPGVLTAFDKYRADLIDKAPTPAAKEFVSAHLTQMRTSIGTDALGFEGAARVNLRIDNANTSIDNAAKTVQQDPRQYSTMMALLRETMPAVGPDVQQKLNDAARLALTNAAASQAMDADPYKVQDATSKAWAGRASRGRPACRGSMTRPRRR